MYKMVQKEWRSGNSSSLDAGRIKEGGLRKQLKICRELVAGEEAACKYLV